MPRRDPGPAEQQLLAYAHANGVPVTATQLERWRSHGLIPANTRRALGRGKGSASSPADGAAELVMFLGRQARAGKRPHDLALAAYDAGLPVPLETVKNALRASVHRVVLAAEKELPPPADPADRADWAWDIAQKELAAHPSSILVPRRMRRIDERLGQLMPWSHESVAKFDKGPAQSEPMAASDLDALSAAAVLAGGAEVAGPAMAQMLRAISPEGAALAAASMLEYEDNPDLTQISDGAGFTMMPAGDMREGLLLVVDQATPDEVAVAWRTAARQRIWALQLLADVEAELDEGQLGPAGLEWFLGTVLGLHRMVVRTELRTRRDTLAARAATAVSLLHTGRALRLLRQAIPDGQFGLLPVILPQFMHELAEVTTPPGATLLSYILGDLPLTGA